MKIARIKVVLIVLAVALVLVAAVIPATASAAEKPKLNLKKLTIPVKTGKYNNHMYIWLKGTKKKVRWSTSNRKIVSIDKTGDRYCVSILTRKKGKATITAKVGKKKYRCRVKVTKAMSKAKLKKLISVNTSTVKRQYVTFRNKSKKYHLTLYGKIYLYDERGYKADWDEPYVHLKPGQSLKVCIKNPHKCPRAVFKKETASIDYEYHPIKASAKKRAVTKDNYLPVVVKNKSHYKESLYYVTLFFRKKGRIVWAQQLDTDGATGKNINPGQSRRIKFWLGSVKADYDKISIQVSRSSGSAFGGGGVE